MSHAYDCSASNRTKIPAKDLQVILNDQLHVISDLFTGTCLSLRTLSYGKAMLWYSVKTCLQRSGLVTISYSNDMSQILYLVSDFAGGVVEDLMSESL